MLLNAFALNEVPINGDLEFVVDGPDLVGVTSIDRTVVMVTCVTRDFEGTAATEDVLVGTGVVERTVLLETSIDRDELGKVVR